MFRNVFSLDILLCQKLMHVGNLFAGTKILSSVIPGHKFNWCFSFPRFLSVATEMTDNAQQSVSGQKAGAKIEARYILIDVCQLNLGFIF